MPLRLLPPRHPPRHRVTDNVAQMSCAYLEIATNSDWQTIQLVTYDLPAFVATDSAHCLCTLTVSQVGQRAQHEPRSRALQQVGTAAHSKGYAQFLQDSLEGETNGAAAVEDGDTIWGSTLTDQLGDGASNLARLNLWRGVATNHDFSWCREDRLVVLIHASAVVPYQPFRGLHDLGRRAVVSIQKMRDRPCIALSEVEDMPDIRCSKRIERLVIVADDP